MAVLEMISGLISLFASVLMVCSILLSRKKLSTTFHRLLTALCISDIVSSLAVSFSSFLSPTETGIWLASGTFATCSIQGFFKIFGIIAAPMYNCAVCIFYLLVIKFNKSDEYIKKKFEPFLLLVPFLWASALGANLWITKAFNPHYASCYVLDYPFSCSNDPQVDCVRGEDAWSSPFYILTSLVSISVVPVTIVTTLTLIHRTILKQEQRMSRFGRGSLNLHTHSVVSSSPGVRSPSNVSPSLSKESLTQLVAYCCAWLIPNIWLVIFLFDRLVHDRNPPIWLRMCFHFFYPIQGLFNLIAFIVPRFRRTRKSHTNYSIKEALWVVLNLSPASEDEEDTVAMPPRGNALRRQSSSLLNSSSGIHTSGTTGNAFTSVKGISPYRWRAVSAAPRPLLVSQ